MRAKNACLRFSKVVVTANATCQLTIIIIVKFVVFAGTTVSFVNHEHYWCIVFVLQNRYEMIDTIFWKLYSFTPLITKPYTLTNHRWPMDASILLLINMILMLFTNIRQTCQVGKVRNRSILRFWVAQIVVLLTNDMGPTVWGPGARG